MNIKTLVLNALVAGIYVVLTLVNPIGFGSIQFRISEIVALLPFYDKRYIPGCLLGVAIANAFSPLGVIDVAFGLGIVLIAYYLLNLLPNLFLKLISYSITCGIGVAAELYLVASVPFFMSFISIFISMLVISFISIPVDKWIVKEIQARVNKA